MKQPIYEEVIFERPDYEHINDVLSTHAIGKAPVFSLTEHFDLEETELLINNIKMILIDKKVHPCFPYPFYIVTPHEIEDQFIPIVTNRNELPKFYKHKAKRLRKSENQILQKSHILIEKINNLNIPHKHLELLNKVKDSKKLHDKTKELHFYQNIYNKLLLNES